jgi:putative nucleotidyltransferase with HDIG domain
VSSRDRVLARVRDIPTLPAGSVEVIRLLQDREVDVTALGRAIEFDPGLTSNVLRWANSVRFAGARTIGSVREAVVRIGLGNLVQLLVPMTVAQMARNPVRGYDLPPGGLLDHSVGVAAGSQALAEMKGLPFPREAFTAALLHDIGKVVLGTFVEVDAAAILRVASEEEIPFDAAERRVLGIDHAEAGAALLASWNCPPAIVEAARWHHQPAACPGGVKEVALIHLADVLSLAGGGGTGADGLNYAVCGEAVAAWDLSEDAFETAACRMAVALEEMRALFGKVMEASR